jgi:mitogen-activated protein kinase organizer 1
MYGRSSYGESMLMMFSGSFDATVRIWDSKSKSYQPIQVFSEAKDSISSLCVAGHEIVAGSVDGRVRTYDLRMGLRVEDMVGRMLCPSARFKWLAR